MTLTRLRRKIFGRRSVRARIAVACAGLFLVIAAAFTAAIYTVVDRSFGPAPPPNSIPAGLVRTCQAAEANHTLKLDPALLTQCEYFLGAANQRTNDLHQLLLWSLAGLGVATIVAGISGWAIGRRILLPLHTITTAARRASRERLDERISLDGPADELKELADTFDDMLDRLDLAFASQRRFVANASHELRTPLTSMRTLIDVAMAKPTRTTEQLEVLAGRVREALDQSDALIDGLLTLARSDRGLTTRELVDLEAAAEDAIDHASTAARTSEHRHRRRPVTRPHPRRPGPARAPRRQPARQRRPLQPHRRLGKSRNGLRRRRVVHHRHQQRAARAGVGSDVLVRTLHAPRGKSQQQPTAPGSDYPSSPRSSTPTTVTSTPKPSPTEE